jgi:hypothetical protein
MKQKLITISVTVLAGENEDSEVIASAIYDGAVDRIPCYSKTHGIEQNITVLEAEVVSEYPAEDVA